VPALVFARIKYIASRAVAGVTVAAQPCGTDAANPMSPPFRKNESYGYHCVASQPRRIVLRHSFFLLNKKAGGPQASGRPQVTNGSFRKHSRGDMAKCEGDFSSETIQKIKANPDSEYLSQPCAACGSYVIARNYSGIWTPDSHSKPRAPKIAKRGGNKS
jgi:hypothetical protein